jgi:hypothetical protein
MAIVRYVCPFCKKEFPGCYWVIPNRYGSFGSVPMKGLALANFDRHKRACREKQKMADSPTLKFCPLSQTRSETP